MLVRTYVTELNLDQVRDECAYDQRREIVPGCEHWVFVTDVDGRVRGGEMTRWPDGRGAVTWSWEEESTWGRWNGDVLRLETGEWVDEHGSLCTPDVHHRAEDERRTERDPEPCEG